MSKKIAIISYDLDPTSSLTADAIAIQSKLNAAGFSTKLVHQWSLNEPDTADFKKATYWGKFDGIVICNFYGFWNLRELILSKKPVMCVNSGYADDLGLGESPLEHVTESSFNLINNTHPITIGLGLGAFGIGSPVWLDSISTLNHDVVVLVNTLANHPVLVAHKTHKLSYFGWYRMSQASAGSSLNDLLVRTAKWTFA